MTAAKWVSAFCEEIGESAPTQAEFDEILKLASVAAHASERMAAPVACFIAGRSGRPLAELRAVAEGAGG
jgi:Domain of unknown function (DUF6457)